MHVVAVCVWKQETADLLPSLAKALGVTLYEARQRMIGGAPAVVACLADRQQARDLVINLRRAGISSCLVDASAVCGKVCSFIVRRFELGMSSLYIEAGDGESLSIPYEEIRLFLPAMDISGHAEKKMVTERKLSLGKTLLSGGIPMTKKVSHEEEAQSEERRKLLYIFGGGMRPAVFGQDGMTYDGFGPEMKPSRELNFAALLGKLRERAAHAMLDERLLTRLGQIKLLGPAQNAANGLDLAAAVLAACLLSTGEDTPGQ
ncbi:MAG TPA: hypothetical protein VEP69_00325 [Thermodesulfovibrionales bacterium]|nr:hypothetical protein [Thermodesulfovibrionales bacterium]